MAMQRRFQFIEENPLVEMAQRGSLEAYDELVIRFRPAVILVARQILVSPEAAQDVAQEAFLLAFRSLSQLQDPARFAGWLYTITRHRARRVAARQNSFQTIEMSHPETLDLVADDENNSPLAMVLQTERQEAIRTLLATLSPECQIVLQLFYYEQWPAVRIAAFLSLPLTTIKWRLRYGRQQLCAQAADLILDD